VLATAAAATAAADLLALKPPLLHVLCTTGEDIQDLTVMSQPTPQQQPKSSVPDDPAIISAVRVTQLGNHLLLQQHTSAANHSNYVLCTCRALPPPQDCMDQAAMVPQQQHHPQCTAG
jgi:hypothetical protein